MDSRQLDISIAVIGVLVPLAVVLGVVLLYLRQQRNPTQTSKLDEEPVSLTKT